jgi:hypothetical protein
MRKYYEIVRVEDCHSNYVDFADEFLIKAFGVYKEFYFISKKKRLKLIKDLAINQLMDIEYNLCDSNWICLSKSEKKVSVVREFIRGSINTIESVTSMKRL